MGVPVQWGPMSGGGIIGDWGQRVWGRAFLGIEAGGLSMLRSNASWVMATWAPSLWAEWLTDWQKVTTGNITWRVVIIASKTYCIVGMYYCQRWEKWWHSLPGYYLCLHLQYTLLDLSFIPTNYCFRNWSLIPISILKLVIYNKTQPDS